MTSPSPSPSPQRQRSDTMEATPSHKRKRSEESLDKRPEESRVKKQARFALSPPMEIAKEIWELYLFNGSPDSIDECQNTLVETVNELSGGDVFYGITEPWFSTYQNSKCIRRERVLQKEREERDRQEKETTRLLESLHYDVSDSDSDF